MQTQLIKSITFFQQLLSSQFSTLNQRLVDTLVFLSTCHLFGLTNPNQVADALSIPKARPGTEHDESLSPTYRVFYCVRKYQKVASVSVMCGIPLFFAMERILPTHPIGGLLKPS